MFQFHDYRAFLSKLYAVKKPEGFSYRAFSRTVGLGAPNYLKLVIDGHRNLGSEMALRFAKACGLDAKAIDYFCALVRFNQASTAEQRQTHYQALGAFQRYRKAHKLELADAAYHSNWYIPAIRELTLSSGFEEDAAWIARQMRPSIQAVEAQSALDILSALGLLQRGEDGKLRPSARLVTTGAETSGLHIANYHAEMMARATTAMSEIPALERDISSLTLCLSEKRLEQLKLRIQEFRRELLELSEQESTPQMVIQLNLQLFPLSQPIVESAAIAATSNSSKDSEA